MRAFGVLGIAATAFALAVPVEAREFRSSDVYSADYPTVRAVSHLAELLRQRSNGRMIITDLGDGARESENFTLGQLRNGTLDMARVNLAVLNATVPASVVPSLPYLFRSTDHTRRVLDGAIGQDIMMALEQAGLIGLCFYDAGPRSIYSVAKPIRTPSDLKGMKVWAQQSDSFAVLLRALDAEPVVMPFSRVTAALQAGVVDAAVGSWSTYAAEGHYRMTKYYNLTEHSRPPGVLLFSKRIWDGLSQGEKALIRAAARDSVPYFRQLWDQHEESARRTVEAAGTVIVTDVAYRLFAEAMIPLYPALLRSPQLQAMAERVRSAAREEAARP